MNSGGMLPLVHIIDTVRLSETASCTALRSYAEGVSVLYSMVTVGVSNIGNRIQSVDVCFWPIRGNVTPIEDGETGSNEAKLGVYKQRRFTVGFWKGSASEIDRHIGNTCGTVIRSVPDLSRYLCAVKTSPRGLVNEHRHAPVP